ncbi:hypothetical protein CVT24_007864 [Panaeolus cyanescens]|uniref:ubiquitinyl hydrolase 1 n=1 Tax=Panaeolus cyanescens TaxID=181874 RepID=A0A409VCI5_9AGAR|nr:hypothetical protein CVT24_007864 [Panaeolus cyanescens]
MDSQTNLNLNSRKRQRSQSMQSDSDASSSSAKRSVADNQSSQGTIRSPRPDPQSTLSLTDSNQDIDAYMAQQGEENIPPFTPTASSNLDSPELLRKMHSIIQQEKQQPLQIGQTWYLISKPWYKRWNKACTGDVDKEGPVELKDVGPIDNSSLVDSHGNLLAPLTEGSDYELVPLESWNSLVAAFGLPIHPIPRRVVGRGKNKEPTLELYPFRFVVYELVTDWGLESVNTPRTSITISAGETLQTLCTDLAKAIRPDSTGTPYRVWKVDSTFTNSSLRITLAQMKECSPKIVDADPKILEDEDFQSDDAFVVEFMQTGGWIADAQSLNAVEEPAPIFNSSQSFFNAFNTKSYAPATPPRPNTTTFLSNRAPTTSLTTGSGSITKSLEPGTLGLGNMGNTCFMNSALQCLAHTKELTDYFLSGVYTDELNRDNPLGMGGAIAEAFGALLHRIWATSGVSTSYSPREFKMQLQRFAPQFSGYQQHDSQELVAFLLDGLHEDLNRVLKKPYVEKPDWEGGGDVELVKLANKSWEGYMMRNDSVIVDLFQGQYKSTLVCPECSKISITFDPFMYLTLPLPVHKKWKHDIYFIPWDFDRPHVKVPVEINRDASFKDLKTLLGKWMDVPAENLLTMEIFSHRFYKYLDDSLPLGEMSDNDTIVCFELPCRSRQNRTYKPQPDDPIIIPVYLCDSKPRSKSTYFTNARTSASLFGYPMVIAIDPKDATSIRSIYEVVVSKLARWTIHSRELFTWELDSSAQAVSIPITTSQPADAITEITEDGDVVTVDPSPPEGDIVDEKSLVDEEDIPDLLEAEGIPQKVGPKNDIFNLRLQTDHKDLGTGYNQYNSSNRWESWESREQEAEENPVLLRPDDALYCEFDEDKKSFYFGDSARFENARWDDWELFTHPDFEENKKADARKRHKGLALQDCLDEFTKEEQLGEDDLWYCPQCKKHQQATKKFDLWKAPDVLVVHLKRFSSSRSLRDKIDAHIDFPIEGLDLSNMVEERAVAQRLLESGVDIEQLGLHNLDEPLVYDLFAVDEHMGGLGGGHYRAYASNHLTGKWYHFDDSFVTPARATDSVNANAYLLFYRRRTTSPLGGKSVQKVQEAGSRSKDVQSVVPEDEESSTPIDSQPPPLYEMEDSSMQLIDSALPTGDFFSETWKFRSEDSNTGSSAPSPPQDDSVDPEDVIYHDDNSLFQSHSWMGQEMKRVMIRERPSPTSSNEAEMDLEDNAEADWDDMSQVLTTERSANASPTFSDNSASSPFSDANAHSTSGSGGFHARSDGNDLAEQMTDNSWNKEKP